MRVSERKGWKRLGATFAAVAAVLSATGCDGESNKKEPPEPSPRMQALQKVSVMAAFTLEGVAWEREVACLMQEAFQQESWATKETKPSSGVDGLMRELASEQSFLCQLYAEVESATAQTADLILSTGQLPTPLYAFSLYEPCCEGADQEAYSEQVIGLFLNVEECQHFEEAVRARDIPTRRCYIWSDELSTTGS